MTFEVVWLALSALAHLHGSLPFLASQSLQDIAHAKLTGNDSAVEAIVEASPVLQAYRVWCTTDRRYCDSNACVMCFQFMTFVYATPGCLLLAALIWKGNKVERHVLQILLCVGQIYGTVMYFGTAWIASFADINSDPLHFYLLFVGLNALWIVIPAGMLVQSCTHVLGAMEEPI